VAAVAEIHRRAVWIALGYTTPWPTLTLRPSALMIPSVTLP